MCDSTVSMMEIPVILTRKPLLLGSQHVVSLIQNRGAARAKPVNYFSFDTSENGWNHLIML
jgi:hypothetical protein